MITELLEGAALVAITVFVHAAALTWVLWRLHRWWLTGDASILHDWIVFVRVAVVCVFVHLIEIGIWAAYFFWEGTISSLDLAVYFSAVTYATIGSVDVTRAAHLRLIASMEGLTGILMCAWSGGFFFSVVTKVWDRRIAAIRGPAR